MSLSQQREMQKRIRRILEQQGIGFDGIKYIRIKRRIKV